jgi:hypothetical protein
MVVDILEDRLDQEFHSDRVFRDISNIGLGVDYRVAIRRELESCYAVLAVVGPRWLDLRDDEGRRKIDSVRDPVREELEQALERDPQIRVIPVLVGGATMPRASDLPDSVAAFAYREYHVLPTRGFAKALEGLIHRIETPRHSRFGEWADITRLAPVWALVVNALWRPLWANALIAVSTIVAFLLTGALWLIPIGLVIYLALGATTLFDLQQARCVHECLAVVASESAHDTQATPAH